MIHPAVFRNSWKQALRCVKDIPQSHAANCSSATREAFWPFFLPPFRVPDFSSVLSGEGSSRGLLQYGWSSSFALKMSRFKEPSTSIWFELSSFCASSMDKGPFAKSSLTSESCKEDCNSIIPSTPITSHGSASSWPETAVSFAITQIRTSELQSSARASPISTSCPVSACREAPALSSGGTVPALPSCPPAPGSSARSTASCTWSLSDAGTSFSSPEDLGVLLFISDKLYWFQRQLLLDFQQGNQLHNPPSRSRRSVSRWSLVTFCTHLGLIFLNLQVLPLARSSGDLIILYRNLTIESFLCIINKDLFFTLLWLNLDLFTVVKGPQVPFHSFCNSISFYSCLKLPGLCCPHHYCSPPHRLSCTKLPFFTGNAAPRCVPHETQWTLPEMLLRGAPVSNSLSKGSSLWKDSLLSFLTASPDGLSALRLGQELFALGIFVRKALWFNSRFLISFCI